MKKGQSVVFTAKATTATPSNRPRSWLESLPDDFKSELVQARERGQVRAGQAKVASGTSRPSAIRGMSRCRHAYRADWFRGVSARIR